MPQEGRQGRSIPVTGREPTTLLGGGRAGPPLGGGRQSRHETSAKENMFPLRNWEIVLQTDSWAWQ